MYICMFLLPRKNQVFHILIVRGIVTERSRKAKSVNRTKGQLTHTRKRWIPNTLINIKHLIINSPRGFSRIYNTVWGPLPDCLGCSLQLVKYWVMNDPSVMWMWIWLIDNMRGHFVTSPGILSRPTRSDYLKVRRGLRFFVLIRED